jgi:hypothetical protein
MTSTSLLRRVLPPSAPSRDPSLPGEGREGLGVLTP